MLRPTYAPPWILLGLCAAVVFAGCGGGQKAAVEPVAQGDPFTYNQEVPLSVAATTVPTLEVPKLLGVRLPASAMKLVSQFDVRKVSYQTFDDTRVPALFAIPRTVPVRGCLMFQGGIGQTKEDAAPLWPGAAGLGLATFSIDARDTGSRGGISVLARDVRSASSIRRVVDDTVIDWRRGIDYLESQPVCHHNIGFLGTSFGGVVGALLAGVDPRVRAAVITSVGATWRAGLLASNMLLPGVNRAASNFRGAVDELAPIDPARWVPRISPRPVMIINGTKDPYTPTSDAAALAAAARNPKVIYNYDGNHFPFSGPWAQGVATHIAAFLKQYLVNT